MSRKQLDWVGTAKDDFDAFPRPVKRQMGNALRAAQEGGKDASAKPFKGFPGVTVMQITERFDETYRVMYAVRLRHAIYVRHCFHKKSTQGIATPKRETDLVRSRLRDAERMDRERGAMDG